MTLAGFWDFGIGDTTPGTPGVSGTRRFYFRPSDGKPAYKDNGGVETLFGLIGPAGPSNAVYLSVGGVDGSAARGDASKPFGTFKAAVQACQNGDVLRIGPGAFTLAGAADVPAWPAGLHQLAIEGSGCDLTGGGGTTITNTGNDGSHIFQPPSHVTYLGIRNLKAVVTLGSGRPLYCDGTGSGGNYLGGSFNGSLVLIDCAFFNAANTFSARLKDVGLTVMSNVFFEIGGNTKMEVISSGAIFATGCVFGKIDHSYDSTDVDRPGFSAGSVFRACSWTSDLKLIGGPQKLEFHSCTLHIVSGNALTDSLGITQYGGFVEQYDFSGNPMFDSPSNRFDLYGVKVNTALKLKMAGAPPANTLRATARGCDLVNIGGFNIIADNGIILDVRGSNYQLDGGQFVTPGNGKLHLSRILRNYTTSGTSPDTVSFDIGGSLTFDGQPDWCRAANAGDVNAGTVAATPVSASQARIDYSGTAGGITLESIWK